MDSKEDGSVSFDDGQVSSVASNFFKSNSEEHNLGWRASVCDEEETNSALSRWNEEFQRLLDENP